MSTAKSSTTSEKDLIRKKINRYRAENVTIKLREGVTLVENATMEFDQLILIEERETRVMEFDGWTTPRLEE